MARYDADVLLHPIVPEHVYLDRTMSAIAVCLYAELDRRLLGMSRPIAINTLASDLGISTPTVHRALRQLKDAKYVRIERTGRSSVFTLINPSRKCLESQLGADHG